MNSELLMAINMLEKERGISKDALFDAIEASFVAASKNLFGQTANIKVEIDRESGEWRLFQKLTVVRDDELEDPVTQITKDQLKAKYGVKLKLGEVYLHEFESADFGRIASQNAKNVILQKIREEERRSVFDQFHAKEGQIVTGTVQRQIGRDLTINLGKADGRLKESEQVRSEFYKHGDRIKVYVLRVENQTKGPIIMVSRSHPELVRKLFESEVAEMQSGIVEIKAIAREAGSRTKIAVWSNDENVDPIGACVGVNGTRVNAVVDELGGEKIDIICWSDNSAELIENAISPAKVICVLADDEEKTAIVVVPDYQLSLAIGKNGQNARLAARLTGYKIDIKSETQARESGLFEEIGYIEDYYEQDEEEYGQEGEYYEDGDYDEGLIAEGSEKENAGEEPEVMYEDEETGEETEA